MCTWCRQRELSVQTAVLTYILTAFFYHGLSKTIVCDQEPRFTAAFLKELFALLETKLKMSYANHPKTDGQTKRMNRVVEDNIHAFVNHQQTNWDEVLPVCIGKKYLADTTR